MGFRRVNIPSSAFKSVSNSSRCKRLTPHIGDLQFGIKKHATPIDANHPIKPPFPKTTNYKCRTSKALHDATTSEPTATIADSPLTQTPTIQSYFWQDCQGCGKRCKIRQNSMAVQLQTSNNDGNNDNSTTIASTNNGDDNVESYPFSSSYMDNLKNIKVFCREACKQQHLKLGGPSQVYGRSNNSDVTARWCVVADNAAVLPEVSVSDAHVNNTQSPTSHHNKALERIRSRRNERVLSSQVMIPRPSFKVGDTICSRSGKKCGSSYDQKRAGVINEVYYDKGGNLKLLVLWFRPKDPVTIREQIDLCYKLESTCEYSMMTQSEKHKKNCDLSLSDFRILDHTRLPNSSNVIDESDVLSKLCFSANRVYTPLQLYQMKLKPVVLNTNTNNNNNTTNDNTTITTTTNVNVNINTATNPNTTTYVDAGAASADVSAMNGNVNTNKARHDDDGDDDDDDDDPNVFATPTNSAQRRNTTNVLSSTSSLPATAWQQGTKSSIENIKRSIQRAMYEVARNEKLWERRLAIPPLLSTTQNKRLSPFDVFCCLHAGTLKKLHSFHLTTASPFISGKLRGILLSKQLYRALPRNVITKYAALEKLLNADDGVVQPSSQLPLTTPQARQTQKRVQVDQGTSKRKYGLKRAKTQKKTPQHLPAAATTTPTLNFFPGAPTTPTTSTTTTTTTATTTATATTTTPATTLKAAKNSKKFKPTKKLRVLKHPKDHATATASSSSSSSSLATSLLSPALPFGTTLTTMDTTMDMTMDMTMSKKKTRKTKMPKMAGVKKRRKANDDKDVGGVSEESLERVLLRQEQTRMHEHQWALVCKKKPWQFVSTWEMQPNTQTHTQTHTQAPTNTCTNTHPNTQAHTQTHTQTPTNTYTYTNTHSSTQTHTQTPTNTHTTPSC